MSADKLARRRDLAKSRAPAALRALARRRVLVPLASLALLLALGGVFFLARDGGEGAAPIGEPPSDFPSGDAQGARREDASEPPPSPRYYLAPRWFRSNASGMPLEEIPSRLVALRNRHALVIDYIRPYELEPFLAPFLEDGFRIEARVLFERGEEARRQWLFFDESGGARLNAVFRRAPASGLAGNGFLDLAFLAESVAQDAGDDDAFRDLDEVAPPPANVAAEPGGIAPAGFIEVFDEGGRIVRYYSFAEDGAETLAAFYYGEGLLVRIETKTRDPADPAREFLATHTDHFRYNRSRSLRYVLRVFHMDADAEPARVSFPSDLMDEAFWEGFVRAIIPGADFMESFFDAGDGYAVRYETDARGRVLSQTMLDPSGEIAWQIRNEWRDDRVVSISRVEGGDERLTEFEFDAAGNRTLQRDSRNGALERIVRFEDGLEIEELYMDGVLVLTALWRDGRIISEERARR